MKLKTLTIKNIASIEDETIDFAGDKLGRQDLFLICGPTGSGKTTILDAICLALFNKTPRIEGAPKREVINTFAEGNTTNRLNDPMHLVRKNAVNATVTLTFETDGHEYIAKWHAFRSGQYRKGKVTSTFDKLTLAEQISRKLDYEWTLTDDDGHEYTKDVDKEIERVIKMTYNQFCKTTMLAQGDFTKFLTSSSDEKAQILERLVGTDQYAEVGRVINRTANDKKNEVDILRRELENFVFLTDEQKATKIEELAILTAKIQTLSDKKAIIDHQALWITDYIRAIETEMSTKEALDSILQILNAEATKQKQKTISLWDDTADVREALITIRKCDITESETERQKDKLKSEYLKAVAGKQRCADQRQELINKNITLSEIIESQRAYEEMYEQIDVICAKHDAIESNNRFIAENVPLLEAFDLAIAELQDKAAKLNEQKQSANTDIEKIEDLIKGYNESLKEHGSETIDDECRELNRIKTSFLKLENSRAATADAIAEYEIKQKATAEIVAELARMKTEEEKAYASSQDASKVAAESKAVYDKAYISLDNHASALRSQLSVGDDCPVCGRIIEHLLDESELRNILEPLKIKCSDDDSRAKTLATALAQIQAQVKTTVKAQDKARAEETQAKDKVSKCESELKRLCAIFDIAHDDNIDNAIRDLKASIECQEAKLAERQKAIKEIRKQIEICSDKISTIRRLRITPVENRLFDIQKNIDAQSQKKAQTLGAIDNAKAAIESANIALTSLINPDWHPLVQNNYITELKIAAKTYADNKKAISDNNVYIDKLTRDLDLMSSCQQNILSLFPDWDLDNGQLPFVSHFQTQDWVRIQSEANLLSSTIRDNAEKRKAATDKINLFKENKPEGALTEIEKLKLFSSNDIATIRKELAGLTETHTKAKALYDEALKRKYELQKTKPEFDERAWDNSGIDIASLEQQKLLLLSESQSLSSQANDSAVLKGRLQKELETDEENRRLHGTKKTQLDSLRIEYAEWEKLNGYLGNTDGKNFRNIAQSFVLSDLLDKANAYLLNISSRYQLFCHPGTLTIMMRDAYQGGIERTTNTLSGGESFIISLSLALGLSSMQNVDFEVDTLFIDEGFGTLSPEFLDPVITALKRLHQTYGRRVGIISHVESLKQIIPAIIEVKRHGTSSSKISVTIN